MEIKEKPVDLKSDFNDPPYQYKSRPLWVWADATVTTDGIKDFLQESKDRSGYYGFTICAGTGLSPAYLSEEFFSKYGDAVTKAAELGQKLCIYDDYNFPSGFAGGHLAANYPNDLAKRLDMMEEDINGPILYTKAIPTGTLMGVVAMEATTKERIDITNKASNEFLIWNAPTGSWKVMIFVCILDGWDRVDYLEPDSVNKIIEIDHQKYYDHFSSYFGNTIDCMFYDEPAFWNVQGGRTWTPAYNNKFQAKYGYSPAPYYPALWYDIGKDTEAARNALFGFRAELYATGFIKTISDWCNAHKIKLSGHIDQEEVVNPCSITGDLMKAFKYQDIPGVDEISCYGRGSKMYKVVSSAAFNYDKPLIMTETYGAMGESMGIPILYKEAMDQYVKGINYMVPHALWYNNISVIFPPELSYRSAQYGPELSEYNKYIGRLNMMLQYGRHVADIGILYPIATLQAGYHFGVGDPYTGGIIPAEADYMDIGEMLSLDVRRDYTFIHPEVLDEKCQVDGITMKMNNTYNYEQYKVFIIPGSKTIKCSNLQKIKQFYDNGGKVIATTQLPYKSAEFGHDADVANMIQSMFGGMQKLEYLGINPSHYIINTNANGGKAYFTSKPTAACMKAMLDDAMDEYDVEFESDVPVLNGNLSYIHKRKDGTDVYFIANSSDTNIDTYIKLRGNLSVEIWDPHTGTTFRPEYSHMIKNGQNITRVRLMLSAVKSIFIRGI